MTVLGRRSEDLDEFMEKLEATGAFDSVLPAQRDTTDEGLDRLLLEAVYTGEAAEEPAAAAPPAQQPAAPAAKPGTPPAPKQATPQPGRAARGGAGR